MRDGGEQGGRAPARGHAGDRPSAYAWGRMLACLMLGAIGSVGMWSVVVVLPVVQAEFGVQRGGASFPYTLTMLGYAVGGVVMGRLADRAGAMVPVSIGIVSLFVGYLLASQATSLLAFAIAHGLVIGLGSAAVFGPMMTDISMFFVRYRGIAVTVVASGNYLAGTIWSPIVERMTEAFGWRETYVAIALISIVLMLPLVFALNRPRPPQPLPSAVSAGGTLGGLSTRFVTALMMMAGVGCCVAMSMPQVHIVAYCGDLGYGVQRGAEMLSVLLGLGVVSRLLSGWILDQIGGFKTLMIGSVLQAVALALYIPFDSLPALFMISAFFGVVQGGIVPSYAIIVREHFPAEDAGTRFGVILGSTIVGMALGGWISGIIFDYTGSYKAAFANGVAWNMLNIAIMGWLMWRVGRRPRLAPVPERARPPLRRR